MKKILIFKDKTKNDLFDSDDNVKNIMTPKTFSAKKLGLADKQAFLYKGYPMYLDRTVVHARKEDIPHVQELFQESVEQIDEISKETLKSYKDQAGLDIQLKKNAMNKRRLEGKSDEENALKNKRNQRMDYVQKAILKLRNEAVEPKAKRMSNEELTKEAKKIQQKMMDKGIVRPDDQVKHIKHEGDQAAVIHGIIHGTNTLGFRNYLNKRNFNESVSLLTRINRLIKKD